MREWLEGQIESTESLIKSWEAALEDSNTDEEMRAALLESIAELQEQLSELREALAGS